LGLSRARKESVDFYRTPTVGAYGRHPSVLKVFKGVGPTGPWVLAGEINDLGGPIPSEPPDFTRVSTPGTQTRYLRFVLTDCYGGVNFKRMQIREAVINEVKGYRYPPQGAFSVTTQVGPDGNEEKRIRAALPMQRSGRLQLHLDGGSASNLTNTPDGSLVHTFTVCDLDDDGGGFVYMATEGDLVGTALPGGTSKLRLVVTDGEGVRVPGARFSATMEIA
jgi:hypothetical protein